MRRIRIAYDIYTPESLEVGDAEERGWYEEDGVPIELDEFDIEDELTHADLAVRYLRNDWGVSDASSSDYQPGVSVWYTSYGEMESDGSVKNFTFHLYGFTQEEEREIFERLTSQD